MMPLGEPATHAGHTVACRTFQAAAAELDAAAHAPSAGPAARRRVRERLRELLRDDRRICGDLSPYATSAECLSACAGFASLSPFDASDIAGDTIECRLYHLTAASVAPGTHCPHPRGGQQHLPVSRRPASQRLRRARRHDDLRDPHARADPEGHLAQVL
ncbi:MAG: hypothetical protein IPL61_40930 [Myxococcales bacterium]|nr:hypothetical protein [Myxococcales bacterium]